MPTFAALWIAALFAAALAVPLGLFVFLRTPRRGRKVDDLPSQWPLVSRPVFGGVERRLYRQLADALPQHVILAKLPLVRLCQPVDPDPARVRYWFRLLGGTHVSFAVCDANGRVLAAVDLINERARPSQRSQRIKAAVLHACHIRYLTCTPDMLPALPTLRALVPQPFADPAGAAPGAQPPSAAETRPSGAGEFDDSLYLTPGDSVLGELGAASAEAAGTRH